MLPLFFKRLKDNVIVKYVEKFFYSPLHIVLVVTMMMLCNLFAFEYYYLGLNLAGVLLVVLLCKDTLPLTVNFVCGYMATAKQNNPAVYTTSVYFQPAFKIYFIISLSIIAIALLLRLAIRIFYEKKTVKPTLTLGYLALGLSFLLGGLFSPTYDGRTVFFGLVEILALSFTYFYFLFTVDGENFKVEYFAWLFSIVGIALIFETLPLYYFDNEFIFTGYVRYRGGFYTGWGVSNNLAGVLVTCLPAPFALMICKKKVLPFFLIETLLLGGVLLTQSRNGILCSALLANLCFILTVINLPAEKRRILVITVLAIIVICFTLYYIFYEKIFNTFGGLIKAGLASTGRADLYLSGLKQFADYPVFGNGFYVCTGDRIGLEGGFLPARYHDSYVQLLSCCGIVGILAYAFHRFETVKLFLKVKDEKNVYLAISALALPLGSILDCFFFNFGPGIIAGVILAYMEMLLRKKEKDGNN